MGARSWTGGDDTYRAERTNSPWDAACQSCPWKHTGPNAQRNARNHTIASGHVTKAVRSHAVTFSPWDAAAPTPGEGEAP